MLSRENFLNVVANAPLVSVDLIIRHDDEVLLGLRKNRPAQGYWFVPGGRIFKNETIKNAIERIAKNEIGLDLTQTPHAGVAFLGTFEHFYDDCFADEMAVSTHYVVLAHQINVHDLSIVADSQHVELKWWRIADLLSSTQVHVYSKNYFLNMING